MNSTIRLTAKILLVCMMVGTLAVPAYATETTETPNATVVDFNETVEATETETESVFDKVPRYYQNDYPKTKYGSGVLKDNGCGITSLAMVVSYLAGEEIKPDDLAELVDDYRGGLMSRMLYAADTIGLKYEKTYSWKKTYEALENGKVCIALMHEGSPFTDSQHFVVLCGVTEEGRVVVNDPWKPNYKKMPKRLKEMGFKPEQIDSGFSGAWIFDKP